MTSSISVPRGGHRNPRSVRLAPLLALVLTLVLALTGSGLLTPPASADDTAPAQKSDFSLVNHGSSQLEVRFGQPRGWTTHFRVISARNRMFTKARKEYLVPVTWSGVRIPHLARTGDGNYTYVALAQEHRDGASTAASLDQVGANGVLGQVAPMARNSTGFSGGVRWLMPPVTVPPTAGPRVSVGSFNIRDSWLADKGPQNWLKRRGRVVEQVRGSGVEVLLLQESGGPGARGKRGIRQWQYLDKKLGRTWKSVTDEEFFSGTRRTLVRSVKGKPRVVRATAKPGKKGKKSKRGQRYLQQGVRILYRSDRYQLRAAGWAPMPHVNRKQSFPTPWALLRDRSSGAEFYVMSFHLAAGTSQQYTALRVRQARWLADRAARLGSSGRPVVLGGDLNSSKQGEVSVDASDVLFSRGFQDAASALTRVNLNYPSTGGFTPHTLTDTWPRRIDTIMVRGGVGGSYRYTNHIRRGSQGIASDHFLQSAALPLRAR